MQQTYVLPRLIVLSFSNIENQVNHQKGTNKGRVVLLMLFNEQQQRKHKVHADSLFGIVLAFNTARDVAHLTWKYMYETLIKW